MKNNIYKTRPISASLLSFAIGLIVFLQGCSDPNEETTPAANVTTVNASEITDNSALIEGTVTGDGIVSRGVVYNDSGEPTTDDQVVTSGEGEGSFTVEISNLNPETTYFYKIFATNSSGTVYGSEKSFETLPGLPTVMSDSVSVVRFDSVLVFATVAGSAVDEKGVLLAENENINFDNAIKYGQSSGEGELKVSIGNLTDETTYFARPYALSGSEVVYGEVLEFKTTSIPLTAEITEIGEITTSTIVITASVTGRAIIEKGIVYAESENVDLENATKAETFEEGDEFTIQLENLIDGTDYFIKSYAISETDTSYSEERVLRTESIPLSVDEVVVTDIQLNAATLASEALGSRIVDKGFVYGTTTNLDLENGTKLSSGTEGVGAYNLLVENLETFTDYNVIAYVYSDEDTAFSALSTFKTLADLASVTTLTVSAISETTAESGGEATGNNISQKGVVWGTATEPTLDDNFTENGADAGEFTSSLTDLSPKTTYYVRAYVTNDAGTAYGNERSFTTQGNLNVVSVVPSDGATGVAKTANIEVTFDEDLDLTTITEANFGLSAPSELFDIQVNITQQSGSNKIIINPESDLTEGETYTLFIGTTVESVAGNVLSENFSSSFTVFGDVTSPTIESISPASGATGVSQSFLSADITFSEEIDPATLTNTNFKVFRAGSEANVTVEQGSDSKIVKVRVSDIVYGNTEYEVRVGTGVKDLAGNNLVEDFSSKFTTANFNFSLSNVVSSFENSNRELRENFIVDGTYDLAESNLNAGLITMTQGTTNVPVTLSIVDGNIVINPNSDLTEFQTEYRIQVAAGLKDIYNNVSSRTRDVTFTTIQFSSLYWYSIQPSNTSGDSFIRVGSTSNKSIELGSISGNRTGHWGFNRNESTGRYSINHRLFTNDYLRDTNFDDNNMSSLQLTTFNSPNSFWAVQRRSETTVRRFSMQNQFNSTGAYLNYTFDFPNDILDAKDNGDPTNSSFWFKIERGPAR